MSRPSASLRARPVPWARLAVGVCLVGVAGSSIWIERQAHASLHTSRANPGDVVLTLHGVELHNVSSTVRGMPIEAAEVRIRPTWDGVLVEVDGLSGGRVAARTQQESPPSGADQRRHDRTAFDSIPVEIRTTGSITLFDNELGRVELHDPSARRDSNGDWTGSVSLGVEVAGQLAHAHLDANRDAGDIVLAGTGAFDGGDSVGVAARLEDDAWRLEVADEHGGSALIEIKNPTQDSPAMVARADQFDLSVVAPIVAALPMPRASDEIDLSHAELSGTLRVEPRATGTWASLQDVTVEGLTAKVAALSPHPLEFEPLSLAGDLTRTRSVDGPVGLGGWLSVEHGGTQLELAGARSGSLISLSAQLPTRDCQALFESMPSGLLPVLDGMQLDGEVAGHFELSFDQEDLTTELPVPELVDEPQWPGELAFEFPVLERCAVVREPTAVDLEALAGPYRHRFKDDAQGIQERILAPGSPHYVSSRAVPELVAAFVVMEDTRFFRHDGFEPQQIERAVWFNLGAGRFARGASTISQQTARNLWLGMDRSLGRKLQEAMLTSMLEANLDKRRILELYLNIIELGPNVYGVSEAARYHFGKPAQRLTQLEAAHLASLAPAPVSLSRRFSDGRIDDEWREHLLYQIKRMDFHNMITGDAATKARKSRLELVAHDRP